MSAIGDQFKGLDMKNLIGGPLTAAAEASIMLAQSTADFIQQVGFDAEQKTRNILFKYQRSVPDPDGNVSNQEMAMELPLLAIVPIPNLQIDEVNVIFDMEVKNSERSEDAFSASASMSASGGFGPVKVSISGSVSASKSNTRSSDNSAKYHVDVRATNHGIPEGLARVLDMMAATISPSLLSSKAVDADGKELTGSDKERNQKIKALRDKSFRLDNAETAARETFDMAVNDLIKKAENKQSSFRIEQQKALNADNIDDKTKADISGKLEKNSSFWDDFKSGIKNTVIASAGAESAPSLKDLYSKDAEAADVKDIDSMDAAFKNAIDACGKWNTTKENQDKNKEEYNSAMMGTEAASTD